MEPTLLDGQFVLVDPGRPVRPGDVVVARHPARPGLELIKRVGAMEDDRVDLRSDNLDQGTDSRHFGPVETGSVLGVVTLVLSDPARRLDA